MSQIERLQERRIAAADQFLGRCLKVNELSNRPLDQVDQPQNQPPLTYQIFLMGILGIFAFVTIVSHRAIFSWPFCQTFEFRQP